MALAHLYLTYASKFPQHCDFWLKLVDEEEQHARWLRRLLVWVREGLGCVRRDRFDVAAATESLARLERMIDEARKPDGTLSDALNAAMEGEIC